MDIIEKLENLPTSDRWIGVYDDTEEAYIPLNGVTSKELSNILKARDKISDLVDYCYRMTEEDDGGNTAHDVWIIMAGEVEQIHLMMREL